MKKLIFIFILLIFALEAISFAQSGPTTTTSQSDSTAIVVGGGSSGGGNRQYPYPTQLYNPGNVPYFGQYPSEGWNVLTNLDMLPLSLSMEQAKSLYKSKVKIEVRLMGKVDHEFWSCRKYLGKIPDPHKVIGYIFIKTNASSTTIDAWAAANIEAMKSGGNGIVIIGRNIEHEAASWSLGFGTSGSYSKLGGSEKDDSIVGGGGSGFNYAKAKKNSMDGFQLLIIQDEYGLKLLDKPSSEDLNVVFRLGLSNGIQSKEIDLDRKIIQYPVFREYKENALNLLNESYQNGYEVGKKQYELLRR